MDLFIAWDGDHIGRMVGQAALADDTEEVRRISQAIDQGNRLWASWVNSVLGEMISYGGDEGRARVPADRLDELERIRQQYSDAVGSAVSVGVGVRLSEADRALLGAKLRGGDQIVLYTPEIEQELAQVQHKDEGQKLFDEYLKAEGFTGSLWQSLRKDEPPEPSPGPEATPENKPNAGGGFTGPQGGDAAASPAGPVAEGSEHSQGEAAHALMDELSSPEGTHAAEDFESELHDHAEESESSDREDQEKNDQQSQVKHQVVQILQQVKKLAPQLEQLRDQAPDLYAAVIGLTQALLVTAKAYVGSDQDQGAKDSEKVVEEKGESKPEESSVSKSESWHRKRRRDCSHFPVKWGGQMRCIRCKRRHRESEFVLKKSIGTPLKLGAAFLRPDGRVVNTGSFHDATHPEIADIPEHEWDTLVAGFVDHNTGKFYTRQEAADAVKATTGFSYLKRDETDPALEKVRLPEVKPAPTHHHLDLPVGSEKDGKVKVRHEDGRAGWVSVRAGQVLSNDGHPVSSRNPGGK